MHDEAGNVFAKEVLTDDMKAFHLEADRLGITALRLKLEAFEKSLTSIKEPIRHDHPTEGRKIPNTIDGVHIGDHYFGTAYAYEIVLENGKSRFTDITMRDCRLVYFDGRPSDIDHDCCYEINGANEELAKRKRFAEHSIAYLKSRIALGPNGCELSSSLAYEQERKNVMKLSRHLKRMKAHSLRLQKPNWVSLPGDHIRVDGFGSRWQIQGYVVAQYRNFDGMTIRTAPSEGVGVRKLQDEVLIVGTVPVVAPIVAIIDVVKRYWPSASRSLRKRLDRGYLFSRYWKSVKGKHADFHSGSPHQWELYESTKYLNNLIETHTAAIELANRKVNDYRAFRRDQKLKSTDSDLNGLAEANAQKRQMEIAFEFEETEEQLSDYMCEVDYLRSQLERMRDPKKIQIEGNHEFKLGKNTHSHSDFYCYQFQDFDNRWVSTAASQGQCKISPANSDGLIAPPPCSHRETQAESDLAWMIETVSCEIDELLLLHVELSKIYDQAKLCKPETPTALELKGPVPIHKSLDLLTKERDMRIEAVERDANLDVITRNRTIESIHNQFKEDFIFVAGRPFEGAGS